jgi:membrane fusion protein, multidrug efflux system
MPRHFIHIAAVTALSFIAASCSPSANPSGAAAAGGRSGAGGRAGAGGPVPVVTTRAVNKAVPVTVPAVGTVEATSTAQIRSQVTGQLTAIHFTEGQEVRKGEPLFTLDSRSFKATLAQAEATLARDTATLHYSAAQQARSESLFQRGLISKEGFDSLRATTAAMEATVEADKAAIETARLNVLFTNILAPASGRTGSLGAHVGDMVRSSDSTALVVINQMEPIYVSFSVPGRYLSDIRRYQAQKPLTVLAAIPDASNSDVTAATTVETGVVTFIDNAVDTTTGTIRLKGAFPNADRQLWPGSFVRVTLNLTADPNAVVVPAIAVQTSQDGQYVYLVKPDRTVEMRKVRVERQQGDDAVMAEGVAAGDEVVTEGHLRLTPGAKVFVPGESGAAGGRRPSAAPAGPGR